MFERREREEWDRGAALLLKLKGMTREPGQLFLNAEKGILMVSGTAQETELIRDLIQNPPTNAIAYLKSLSDGLAASAPR